MRASLSRMAVVLPTAVARLSTPAAFFTYPRNIPHFGGRLQATALDGVWRARIAESPDSAGPSALLWMSLDGNLVEAGGIEPRPKTAERWPLHAYSAI